MSNITNNNIPISDMSFDQLTLKYWLYESEEAFDEIVRRLNNDLSENFEWRNKANNARFMPKNDSKQIINNVRSLVNNNIWDQPLRNELFQAILGKIYVNRSESDYVLDYLSDQQIIKVIKSLTKEQLRELKIHYILNYPNYVNIITVLITKAYDFPYSDDEFYADILASIPLVFLFRGVVL